MKLKSLAAALSMLIVSSCYVDPEPDALLTLLDMLLDSSPTTALESACNASLTTGLSTTPSSLVFVPNPMPSLSSPSSAYIAFFSGTYTSGQKIVVRTSFAMHVDNQVFPPSPSYIGTSCSPSGVQIANSVIIACLYDEYTITCTLKDADTNGPYPSGQYVFTVLANSDSSLPPSGVTVELQ